MTKDSIQFEIIGQKLKVTKMHPVQSIGYAAAYPAYPLNPPLDRGIPTFRSVDVIVFDQLPTI